MKNKLINLIAAIVLTIGLTSNAQTNLVDSKEFGGYEFTLSGGGVTIDGESEYGLDFSLSTNPLEFAPNIWFGVAQGLYFEPDFAGSTDVFVDYNIHLYGELYVNVGWFGGVVYDGYDHFYRTGPELTLQYYTSDNAFIFAGVNYDIDINNDQVSGFRYGIGLGLSF
jgi:hypothetical protein